MILSQISNLWHESISFLIFHKCLLLGFIISCKEKSHEITKSQQLGTIVVIPVVPNQNSSLQKK